MFRAKQIYKSEKSVRELRKTLDDLITQNNDDFIIVKLDRKFNKGIPKRKEADSKVNIKKLRSEVSDNSNIFYLVHACKTRQVGDTTILELETSFNVVGKYFVLFTMLVSFLVIIKTVYDMIFNYATLLNLFTVLVLIAIVQLVCYASFRMHKDESLEKLEDNCLLTKVKIKRIPKSSL